MIRNKNNNINSNKIFLTIKKNKINKRCNSILDRQNQKVKIPLLSLLPPKHCIIYPYHNIYVGTILNQVTIVM